MSSTIDKHHISSKLTNYYYLATFIYSNLDGERGETLNFEEERERERERSNQNTRYCVYCKLPQICIRGDYTILVHSHSFSNPSNRCAQCQFGCCDQFGTTVCTGTDRCDTLFTYCLLPFNSTTLCTPQAVSGTAFDDRSIDFTQATVLGLPNPLPLSGVSERWEVSLH